MMTPPLPAANPLCLRVACRTCYAGAHCVHSSSGTADRRLREQDLGAGQGIQIEEQNCFVGDDTLFTVGEL